MLYKIFPCRKNPFEVFRYFEHERHVFLLESSLRDPRRGRYSFLGFAPFAVHARRDRNALNTLRSRFNASFLKTSRPGARPTPFAAGAVGFVTYDFGLMQEQLCSSHPGWQLPECFFAFYDVVLTFDHQWGQLCVSSSGAPEASAMGRSRRAAQRLKEVCCGLAMMEARQKAMTPEARAVPRCRPSLSEKRHFSIGSYLSAVQRAKAHIRRGDIYQVNLSQQFEYRTSRPGQVRAGDIYRLLRETSPSCFGAYFDGGDFQIVSSSPERFLRIHGLEAETVPMKGTRPRGATPAKDRRLRQDLWRSAKERAELLMITDLERNDLGRFCRYGSIRVGPLRQLEAYRTVYQTTATVTGRLNPEEDAFSVLERCSPGGSVTGCPKVRAMQIIEELEPVRRSAYTGSLGYIDHSGDMDFNIMIRTILAQAGHYSFHVGGGIVADSDPEQEYEETLVKAAGMRQCLNDLFDIKQR